MSYDEKYCIIDRVLTRINGRYSFYAYQSFDTEAEAEKYIKDKKLPHWRCKIQKIYG